MVAKTTIVRYATACLIVCCFVFSGNQVFAQRDAVPTDPEIISQGEQLFNEYQCNTCHRVESKLVGPALAGVYDRRDIDWIYKWVKNSQALIASGDAQANALFNEYNKTIMAAYDLEDSQIMSILAYVRDREENPPVADTAAAATGDADAAGGGTGVPASYLNIIVGALVVVLLLILAVLALIIGVLKRYLQDKKDLDEADEDVVNESFSLMAFFKSPTVIGIITFLVIALAAKNVIDGLYTIGVQQGYQPKQPIAFSHKIHAGQYEIACQYCHTGVEIGKSANIPSVNICMNCHSSIKTDSPEIQKLYAAQDSGEPIEWVRIHNLPDLAYFNHSQHVKVGEIECQTCHGEIQEMEVVKQHAPLTMGWCIDCHRNTSLNTQGNGYYDKLVELHNKNSATPMKVADIGGLECAKCHY
ncbi:cytochrome c3 family protein [Roseivirga sp.]|uniref:cytochrome c3 family protein n=1 Tax=Roseivirga sp. TaxID=1964215 RepID=UPI003B52F0CA